MPNKIDGVDTDLPANYVTIVGDFIYFGYSTGPGILTTMSSWSIKRVEDIGGSGNSFQTKWAGGSRSPVHRMEDHLTLEYS